MRPRCFFHSRCDIDCISIDTDGALGVTLLAHDDIPAMDADPEGWGDAELSMILAMLSPDGGEYPVDGAQDLVAANRRIPIPLPDQAVAFVEIDVAAEIGDGLRNVEEEFSDECRYPEGTEARRFVFLRHLRDRSVEPHNRFIQTMKLMNEFRQGLAHFKRDSLVAGLDQRGQFAGVFGPLRGESRRGASTLTRSKWFVMLWRGGLSKTARRRCCMGAMPVHCTK